MKTLDRYVIREVLPPFFLSLVIFTFILEIPPVMRELEQLVAKGVSWGTAGRILLTLVPQGLGLTIPMATLTGILIGLGRLSGDREAVALLACGVSPYRLLRPILMFASATTLATLYVMLQAIPDANQAFREITFDLITKRVATDIRPRVFFEQFPGYVLYIRDEDPDAPGVWKDVLVANSTKPDAPTVYMADRGRVVIDRAAQSVQLVLDNGAQYSVGKPGQSSVYEFAKEITVPLDPKTVFQRQDLPRTITEKSIAELRADADRKLLKEGYSPHPEIMYTQQKFSIPAACLVFAVIGLALGLTSARDTKMAGFVIGIVVVFIYYAILEIGAAQTRGHYRAIEDAARQAKNPGLLIHANWALAHLARWWPNIVMGVFGIGALVWRARYAQRGVPVSVPLRMPQLPARWQRTPDDRAPAKATTRPPVRGQGVVIVLRIPRLRIPGGMGVLDRYISRLYLRILGLSFAGLLSLFYISTLVDKAEKVFKGDATAGQMLTFMAYSTPEFVYYVIPLALLVGVLVTFGTLSRTSELTVMKACGISLYRTALPVLALSFVASAALFGLEQRILAESRQKAEAIEAEIRKLPARTFNPINRRWIVGRDNSIYHYALFDPQQRVLTSLSVYRPQTSAWRLASHTYAASASYRDGWTTTRGWERDYSKDPATYAEFGQRELPLEPPDYFGSETPIAQFMTVPELQAHIADLKASGFNWTPLAVELQRKLAFPFVTVVMTLLAVPFGVTTGRRGALYGIGIGIAIALGYWVLLHVFLALGGAGLLPPFLAGWSANIIVAGAAAFLFLNTRT